MELKTKVQTYIINYQCDKCKQGNMVFQGKAKKGIDNKTMMFQHRCNKCSVIQDIKGKQYPQMRYEKVEIKDVDKLLDNLHSESKNLFFYSLTEDCRKSMEEE